MDDDSGPREQLLERRRELEDLDEALDELEDLDHPRDEAGRPLCDGTCDTCPAECFYGAAPSSGDELDQRPLVEDELPWLCARCREWHEPQARGCRFCNAPSPKSRPNSRGSGEPPSTPAHAPVTPGASALRAGASSRRGEARP